jgi:hypothetical protein
LQETFLNARIKVGGKTGQLAGHVTIKRDGNKINVTTEVAFQKRFVVVVACSAAGIVCCDTTIACCTPALTSSQIPQVPDEEVPQEAPAA